MALHNLLARKAATFTEYKVKTETNNKGGLPIPTKIKPIDTLLRADILCWFLPHDISLISVKEESIPKD